MQTHPRKRLEIVLERGLLGPVRGLLDGTPGVTGYTLLPCLGGTGHTGERLPDPMSGAMDTVVVVVVTREETARQLLPPLMRLLEDGIGIVTVADVEVVRAGHF
jgi:PII-like signaling protein